MDGIRKLWENNVAFLRLTMKVFSKVKHLTMLLRASSEGLASTCLSTGLDKATEVPAADAG